MLPSMFCLTQLAFRINFQDKSLRKYPCPPVPPLPMVNDRPWKCVNPSMICCPGMSLCNSYISYNSCFSQISYKFCSSRISFLLKYICERTCVNPSMKCYPGMSLCNSYISYNSCFSQISWNILQILLIKNFFTLWNIFLRGNVWTRQ